MSEQQSTSKYAKAEFEPKNAKEKIQQELKLLRMRKQTMEIKPNNTSTVHKVKKGAIKKGANSKKQKKIARALVVADKEERRIEEAEVKARKRKLGKF
ncbi:hypothetical protein BY458DRAFT_506914 [Sporodiniella umbellata]|nr:hypothetical protein BY458DRAFT_506914 [Sporodiniella umbellata]